MSVQATGFTDSSPQIREATIRAMLVFGPKVRPKTLQVGILRAFAKTQLDPEPVIRANTTVCIGKLAQYIQSDTRNRVLIAAFSRALKDSFVQSKLAGVLGFSTCKEYFTPTEMAKQILPELAPLLVDPSKKIRDEATKMVKIMLDQVVEFGKTIPEPEQPAPQPPKSTTSPSLPSSPSTPTLCSTPSSSPQLSSVHLPPGTSSEMSAIGGCGNTTSASAGGLKLVSTARSPLSELDGWDDAEAAVSSGEEDGLDGWDIGDQLDDTETKGESFLHEKAQQHQTTHPTPNQSKPKALSGASALPKQAQGLKLSAQKADAKTTVRAKKAIQKTGSGGWDDDWEDFLNN